MRAAEKLDELWRALGQSARPGAGGWRESLWRGRGAAGSPRGLYIFGAVGRGKSMLMDLFFAAAPVAAKRRVHFHEFMAEVHARIHEGRGRGPGQNKAGRAQSAGGGPDPFAALAARIAGEARLLCFDEFQVTNIADAMILGRLFAALFERGVVVVAPSNAAPDDLYAGGLQRERFLPTVALLRERLDLLELDAGLDGGLDYRRTLIKGMTVYHTPLGPSASAALEAAFARLTGGATGAPEMLPVLGRELIVARAAKGGAMSSFAELCERPLGSADYLALAEHFHTLILDGVPALGAHQRDARLRFATLIDALYERRVKLVIAAHAAPDLLLDPAGEGAAAFQRPIFQRTISRLHEMQSDAYLAAPHAP